MAAKTDFSEQQLRDILSHYSLGEYTASQPIPQGSVQTNFFLSTTQGRFVFRYYENRSVGSVSFECYLMHYLKNKQFPCPTALKNKKGNYIGIAHDKPYVIFEWIEGQHVEHPTEEQKKQLIQKVAELQLLTKKYRPRYKNQRWNYGRELCRELASAAAQELGTPAAEEKLAWVEHELAKLHLPKSLPKGICHGDFHFSNILFKDGKFHALLDFDDANYTFLIYDLATLINPFLSSFTWETWSRFQQDEQVFDFTEARETALEYGLYRPLRRNEKSHLYDVYKLTILFDCIWYFHRGEGQDFYEKRKIDALNRLGREPFYHQLFI
jgi:homoserine kinase type II